MRYKFLAVMALAVLAALPAPAKAETSLSAEGQATTTRRAPDGTWQRLNEGSDSALDSRFGRRTSPEPSLGAAANSRTQTGRLSRMESGTERDTGVNAQADLRSDRAGQRVGAGVSGSVGGSPGVGVGAGVGTSGNQ